MKKNTVENYYDRVNSVRNYSQLGLLGFLREKLLSFEENRNTTALNLIPKKVDRILDVGCKYGQLLIDAKDKFVRGYGIDLSEKALYMARKAVRDEKLAKRILFKKANIERGLPFTQGSFDLVICLAVIEHLFDPQRAIIEISRIIRRGGYFIIETPNLAWLPRRMTLLFGGRPRTSYAPGWDGGHLSYFTFGSLRKLLEDSGFKVLKIGCSGVFAKVRYLWPSLLSGNIVILAKKR